eukprot:1539822-Pleurochrysis_carterae.AAC.4
MRCSSSSASSTHSAPRSCMFGPSSGKSASASHKCTAPRLSLDEAAASALFPEVNRAFGEVNSSGSAPVVQSGSWWGVRTSAPAQRQRPCESKALSARSRLSPSSRLEPSTKPTSASRTSGACISRCAQRGTQRRGVREPRRRSLGLSGRMHDEATGERLADAQGVECGEGRNTQCVENDGAGLFAQIVMPTAECVRRYGLTWTAAAFGCCSTQANTCTSTANSISCVGTSNDRLGVSKALEIVQEGVCICIAPSL